MLGKDTRLAVRNIRKIKEQYLLRHLIINFHNLVMLNYTHKTSKCFLN